MVVVVELEPAGAEPTVPGSVVVVLDEQEKQPVAVLKAKSTISEQPKRATRRCTIHVDSIFQVSHGKVVGTIGCMSYAGTPIKQKLDNDDESIISCCEWLRFAARTLKGLQDF